MFTCMVLSMVTQCGTTVIYQQVGGLNVTSMPGDIPSDVVQLKILGTSIAGLDSQDFSNLTSLRLFNMGNNQIRFVASDTFHNCRTSITMIALKNNLLKNMSFSIELPFLRSLYLEQNNLNQMPDFCCICPDLKIIRVDQNGITQISPNYFDKTPVLELLRLSNNDLTAFDVEIPSTLTSIFLDRNALMEPPDFTINSSIEILDLSFNAFQLPSDYFTSFINLRELSIEKMGLSVLPDVTKNTR